MASKVQAPKRRPLIFTAQLSPVLAGPGDESSSTASPAAGSDALPSTSSQDAQPVAAQQASEEAAAEPSREPGLRPLPELFDVVRASTRDDVGTIDKESLARLLGTSQSAAGSDAAKQDAPSARPGDRLFNACVGYAALGASRQESKAGAVAEHPRLHPRRLFRPGDMYDPQVCAVLLYAAGYLTALQAKDH